MKSDESKKWALLVVLCAATVISLPWIDRPLYSRGEAREALVAQAMFKTGNWISPPAYNGAVPSKPPLLHWLIGLASMPEGVVSEWSARLPGAIAFVCFSLGFMVFLLHRIPRRQAMLSVLLLLTSPEWLRAGVSSRVDIILATCLSGALLLLYRWWEQGMKGIPFSSIVLLTLSTLTKGPVALVLPAGIFSLFLILRHPGGWRVAIPLLMKRFAPVLFVAFLLSCSWYLLAYLQRGTEFIDRFWYENVQRFAGTMEDEPHKHSFVYLLGMLVVGLLPWSAPALVLLVWHRARVIGDIKRIVRGGEAENNLLSFALIASVTIVLFFCIPSSKRSVYLLPAYPFISLFIARALDGAASATRFFAVVRKVSAVLVVCLLVGGALLLILPISLLPSSVGSICAALRVDISILRVVGTVVCFLGLAYGLHRCGVCHDEGEPSSDAIKAGGALICLTAVIYLVVMGPVSWILSPKNWISSGGGGQFKSASATYYSFGSEMYATSFYLGVPFFRFEERGGVGDTLFVEEGNLARLKNERGFNVREIGRFVAPFSKKRDEVIVGEIEKSADSDPEKGASALNS